MTNEEYVAKMDAYAECLKNNYSDELLEEVSDFQTKFMEGWLARYRETVGDNKAKEYVCEIIEDLIYYCECGVSVMYVSTKELAEEVSNELDAEFGDCLLEQIEVYEDNGEWVVDCNFGGDWCPHWDGWFD